MEVALLVVDDFLDNAKQLIDVTARLMVWTLKDAADDQRGLQRLRYNHGSDDMSLAANLLPRGRSYE